MIDRADLVSIKKVTVAAYTVPTTSPEADGTLQWDATTLVLVTIQAANKTGIGYSYADPATARLITETLLPAIQDCNAWDIPDNWQAMVRAIRNLGDRASRRWQSRRWISRYGISRLRYSMCHC